MADHFNIRRKSDGKFCTGVESLPGVTRYNFATGQPAAVWGKVEADKAIALLPHCELVPVADMAVSASEPKPKAKKSKADNQ